MSDILQEPVVTVNQGPHYKLPYPARLIHGTYFVLTFFCEIDSAHEFQSGGWSDSLPATQITFGHTLIRFGSGLPLAPREPSGLRN